LPTTVSNSLTRTASLDYFSPDRVRHFADYLCEQGQYSRAAGEYQRLLLLVDASGKDADAPSMQHDSIQFLVGRCLRLGKEPERATSQLERFLETRQESGLFDEASYELALTQFGVGDYRRSVAFTIPLARTPAYRDKFHDLRVLNLLCLKDWRQAYAKAGANPSDAGPVDTIATALKQLALAGTRLRYRSLAGAGLMSAVIPGLGKAYSGRFADAAFSLLTIGLTTWQAYEGFRSPGGIRSVKGWVYGAVSATLYLGNIWGSTVAAKQYNDRLQDGLVRKALTLADVLLR
jgi:hypothetical protein